MSSAKAKPPASLLTSVSIEANSVGCTLFVEEASKAFQQTTIYRTLVIGALRVDTMLFRKQSAINGHLVSVRFLALDYRSALTDSLGASASTELYSCWYQTADFMAMFGRRCIGADINFGFRTMYSLTSKYLVRSDYKKIHM